MTRIAKIAAALAVAFMFGVSGCGGGSGAEAVPAGEAPIAGRIPITTHGAAPAARITPDIELSEETRALVQRLGRDPMRIYGKRAVIPGLTPGEAINGR